MTLYAPLWVVLPGRHVKHRAEFVTVAVQIWGRNTVSLVPNFLLVLCIRAFSALHTLPKIVQTWWSSPLNPSDKKLGKLVFFYYRHFIFDTRLSVCGVVACIHKLISGPPKNFPSLHWLNSSEKNWNPMINLSYSLLIQGFYSRH